VSNINDGGPAFPVQESIISSGSTGVPASSGMSLRDYFAAKALQAMLIDPNPNSADFIDPDYKGATDTTVAERVAKRAFSFADAMLAARGEVKP